MLARALGASMALLLSPLMLVECAAQQQFKHPGGNPGRAAVAPAPHAAVPHFAAPPHMAAPHMAAPQRIAPPAPRSAVAPRFAAPRISAPRVVHAPHAAPPTLRGGGRVVAEHQVSRRAEPHRPIPQSPLRAHGPDRSQLRQMRAQEQRQIRDLRAQQRQGRLQQGHQIRGAELRHMRAQEQQQLRDLRAEQRQQRLGSSQAPTFDSRFKGAARTSPETARQGRFAALFQNRGAPARVQADRSAPQLAWHRRHLAAFVPWVGPVFWPYAYNDLFYYAFWPDAYDEGYWAYAYDDFADSVFWQYGNPYASYAYGGAADDLTGRAGSRGSATSNRGEQRAIAQLCEPAKGITAWPFEQIESAVRPTKDQQALLGELKVAAGKAAVAFKASCPGEFSLTPPGRLQAVITRLEATHEALRIVRPPLERFYDSLSDEQKARFNAIGPNIGTDRAQAARNATGGQEAKTCGEPKRGLTDVPIEQIEDVVRPTEQQRHALDRLRETTDKAVAVLQGACPDFVAQTPVGRLEAMNNRIEAMLRAARTVQPALQDFYTSLNNEQKARFNTLGREAPRGG
jgi:hypothetical protein